MPYEELIKAGFLSASSMAAAPHYSGGQFYVRLTPTGALRVFVPADGTQDVELSTGTLLDPNVLFRGSVRDVVALVQLWG